MIYLTRRLWSTGSVLLLFLLGFITLSGCAPEKRIKKLGEDGVAALDQGRYQEATGKFDKGFHRTTRAGQVPESAAFLGLLGAVYLGQGRDSEAVDTLRQSKTLFGSSEHPWRAWTATTANNIALTYKSNGIMNGAVTLLRYSIQLRSPMARLWDPELATTWFNLGETLYELGRFSEAEGCFRASMELDEARPEQKVHAIRRLAWVAQEFGRLDEAYAFLEKARSIMEAQLPDDKLSMAVLYNDLAAVQMDRKKYEGIEPMLLEALDIEEKHYGGRFEHSLAVLGHLATLYQKQGRLDDAKTIQLQMVSISMAAYGREHRDTALALNNLGFTNYLQQDYTASETNLEAAVEIYRMTLNEGHPLLAFPLSNLGNVRLEQRRYAEAEELYTEALMLRIDAFGGEHRAVARSFLDLGKLFRLSGRFEEAEPVVLEALAIREEVYGPVDERVAAALDEYAELLKSVDRLEEAENLVVRAERIRDQL